MRIDKPLESPYSDISPLGKDLWRYGGPRYFSRADSGAAGINCRSRHLLRDDPDFSGALDPSHLLQSDHQSFGQLPHVRVLFIVHAAVLRAPLGEVWRDVSAVHVEISFSHCLR